MHVFLDPNGHLNFEYHLLFPKALLRKDVLAQRFLTLLVFLVLAAFYDQNIVD
jgi:hypothetical protein